MNNIRVLILLSTYNGALFLEEQLDSILNQKGVSIDILIRDDGSTDDTLKILQKYENLKQINVVEGKNVGAAWSFMELLKLAEDRVYDYYAFADQDDFWLNDKLESAVNMISNVDNIETPVLYFSQYQMVDASLENIKTPLYTPKLDFGHALVDNCATGCTMVFNRTLLLYLSKYTPKYLLMHDDWVYKVCLGVGGRVFYDSIPHILYRQHGNNVIGGISSGIIRKWKIRLKKIFSSGLSVRLHVAEELQKGYQQELTSENRKLLLRLVNYRKGFNRFFLMLDKRLRGQNLEGTLRVKYLLLSGKF